MNIKTKIATAIITGSFLAATVLPAVAFGDTGKVVIKKNGAGSTNTATVKNKNKVGVKQANLTAVGNFVVVLQNTGLNSANGNTGDGKVDVNSGDATSTVRNTTTTGENVANVDPCGTCQPGDTTVKIVKNGADSTNRVTVENESKTEVMQFNGTLVINAVVVAQNTGLNSANGNTGDGEINVDSGNAESTITNNTTTGGNVYTPPTL